MKRYIPRLILVLALLLVGCKHQLTNDPFSWGKYNCLFSGEYDSGSSFLSIWATYPPTYNGTFRCTNANGSHLTCPNTGQPAGRAEFSAKLELPRDFTDENFWNLLGCSPASIATPTPTASPQPTATSTRPPTSTPAAAASGQGVAAPLLTGDVSACDLTVGFINFKLVDGAPPITGKDVLVVMNGTQVNCTVPASNATVLSCGLPAGVTFPAQVSVGIGDSLANQFSYNGAACVYAEPTKEAPGNDDESATQVEPTACTGDC